MTFLRRHLAHATAIALFVGIGACGVHAKHGMDVPPKELTYADDCQLQAYFDERAAAGLTAPQANDEMLATNDKGRTIGEGTYLLKDPLSRRRFGKLLRDEYDGGIDRKILHAVESTEGRVLVHVRWWDAGPIRRLRPDDEVTVETPSGDAEIPPDPCVSDFLFGEKVYAMRARFLKNEVDLETGKWDTAGSATTMEPVPMPPPTTTATTPTAMPSASTGSPPP
jgi:hypothetical protein